jgi:hypothetical protein
MPRRTTLALALLLALLALPQTRPARAQSAVARPHPNAKQIVWPDGRARFVLGYNYEGPFDRAWRMWEFHDQALIDADLARARAGGANTVRVFVQRPLPDEILAGNFAKLDALLASAARQGLLVLLTLHDYEERDLAQVAAVNERIAARYRGNPTLLAYDLRNEPQFLDLATSTYPPGANAPLQRADLVGVYGERVARPDIPAWRAANGRPLPPAWSDEQVYAYANNLAFYRDMLTEAEAWVVAGPGRVITDFVADPAFARHQPIWAALNDTLAAYIDAQAAPLRAAAPEHMVTLGWSNLMLARLPANGERLDLISLHRFPRPGVGSVAQSLDLGAGLRRAFPNRPLLFEELGYSTAEADAESAAILEMATALRAYSEGYAGFLKWMLTDLPPVGSPREDNFGAIRTDGGAKPIHTAFGAFGTYLQNTAREPGGVVSVWDSGGPSYSYQADDALYLAGGGGSAPGLSAQLAAPGQLLLRKRGALFLLATQPANVTLELRALVASYTGGPALVEQSAGGGWAEVAHGSDALSFAVAPNTPYRVSLPRATDAAPAREGCRFFPETGHNLCGAFARYWAERGGLAIFGYPISEEFPQVSRQDGRVYTVQYFERNRFEYHPENAGTPFEVLLGLLGNDLTAARRAEPAFAPVGAPPPGADLFPETGHSLGGAFRSYWQRNDGLATFGYPISEEFAERNPADGRIYTVQYFERNRFEYHPENAGTPFEVLLGLLGNQTVDGQGWR